MKSLRNTADLRHLLAETIIAVRDGTMKADAASAIAKIAHQINESFKTEALVRHARKDLADHMGLTLLSNYPPMLESEPEAYAVGGPSGVPQVEPPEPQLDLPEPSDDELNEAAMRRKIRSVLGIAIEPMSVGEITAQLNTKGARLDRGAVRPALLSMVRSKSVEQVSGLGGLERFRLAA